MLEKRILLVEDEDVTRALIKEMLSAKGYKVIDFPDGKVALEAFRGNPFSVVITDIDMPVMDGNELISNLKSIDEQLVIIVLTIHNEPEVIIDIMKKGVFDYAVKPAQANDLMYKVERAFEVAELKKIKKTMEREKVIKLVDQLEWFNWNETFIERDFARVEKTLFHNLHTSFNQGAGFGALLTLITMIFSSAEKAGDKYLIDSNMFDLIKRNAVLAEQTLNVFSDINQLNSIDFKTEKINCDELHSLLGKVIAENKENESKRGQSVKLSEKKPGFANDFISIEKNYFSKAISELLINAFKFSEKNTNIFVILENQDSNSIAVSIISKPARNSKGFEGIPFEYENLVFEPFFRLSEFTFEQFSTLDYGLGLTIVEKIILKLGGKISVSNIVDYSNLQHEPEVKVDFTIVLPILKG